MADRQIAQKSPFVEEFELGGSLRQVGRPAVHTGRFDAFPVTPGARVSAESAGVVISESGHASWQYGKPDCQPQVVAVGSLRGQRAWVIAAQVDHLLRLVERYAWAPGGLQPSKGGIQGGGLHRSRSPAPGR